MPLMEDFEKNLVELLRARPGMSKSRLAETMRLPFDEEFRTELDKACEKELVHKVLDKYYPGSRSTY